MAKWTKKEVDLLQKHAEKCTLNELKTYFPGRSKSSIKNKCHNLGISYISKGPQYWTAEEITLLRKNASRYTLKEMQKEVFPHRTIASVKAKKDVLGLTLKKSPSARRWSYQENTLLKTLYPEYTNKELAENFFPGRTESAIFFKAKSLGLKKNNNNASSGENWTSQEISYLVLNYDQKSVEEIAQDLNRSKNSVYSKARRANLTEKMVLRYRKWSKKDLKYLEKNAGEKSTKFLAKALGRTESSIETKIRDEGFSRKSKHLERKDLYKIFGDLISDTDILKWKEKGLEYSNKGQKHIIKRSSLRNFLKQNPEAVDLYEVSQLGLSMLGIDDIYAWPEPPVYKIIICNGRYNYSHESYGTKFLLFEKRCRCEICGRTLRFWADDYSNE